MREPTYVLSQKNHVSYYCAGCRGGKHTLRHEDKVGGMKHLGQSKGHSKQRVTLGPAQRVRYISLPRLLSNALVCYIFTQSSMNIFSHILKIITLCYESKPLLI